MPDEDQIVIHRIDWEQQDPARDADLRIQYMAGPAGLQALEFVPANSAPEKLDAKGKKLEPTAREAAKAKRHKDLAGGNLAALVGLLQSVSLAAPTFRGKALGAPPRLFRLIITETNAKTIRDGAIVDEPTYTVTGFWGEPGFHKTHELRGSDVQAYAAAVCDEVLDIIEAELDEADAA